MCLSITPVWAETLRTITLKDGSVLKGQVLSLNNGVYKVRTQNIGQIEIEEAKISSISDGTVAQSSQTQQKAQTLPVDISSHLEAMQMNILSDPKNLEQIQALTANESLMRMIQDPNLLKDLMSFDEKTIEGNASIQKI